mgnify:CR=1 FL=1
MDIWLAVVLVVFGLLFLVLEVFVFPGFGVSGIVGLVCLGLGVYLTFQTNDLMGWTVLMGSLSGASILLYVSVKYDLLSRVSLKKNIDYQVKVNHLEELKPEDKGITISRLAPMGKAEINGFVVEVNSMDGFIDQEQAIYITHIKNNTIFVSPIKQQ